MTIQNRAVQMLLTNGSATTTGVWWVGGSGVFTVNATFGGGTVKLQALGPDGATWLDVGTDTTLTAAGMGGFQLPNSMIRVNVATATAVYASVAGY